MPTGRSEGNLADKRRARSTLEKSANRIEQSLYHAGLDERLRYGPRVPDQGNSEPPRFAGIHRVAASGADGGAEPSQGKRTAQKREVARPRCRGLVAPPGAASHEALGAPGPPARYARSRLRRRAVRNPWLTWSARRSRVPRAVRRSLSRCP